MFAALPSVSSEGTLTYTLAANANGVSTFDVQVNDGQDTSPAQTFTINVNTVNDAPVLAPIVPQIVHEGKQLNFTVTATDPNDNPSNNLIITAGNLPSGATFVDGEFSWTPAEGQQGVYVLIFTVTDDGSPALSDWKTVTITVTNVSTWTGEGDGVSWNDEDNWSEHSVPGPYDHAIIDDPNTSTVIIGAEDEVTIKSIQCAANLEVHGSLRLTAGESLVTGKFDVTGTLQVDSGNLSLNGGGLFDCNLYVSDQASVVLQDGNFVAQNINAPAPPALYYRSLVVGNDGNGAGLTVGHATTIEIERLTLRDGGTIDGPGEFRITQRLDWNGGKMAGTGITRNIGSMTVSTPGFNGIIQDARMLYNSGEIRWLGGSGQWRMANEAQILNDNQFIIDVTPGRRADIAPAGVASLPGGGLFSNWGTITQVAEGLGSQFNQIAFMNQATGQVIVQSGTLRFFGVEGASNGTFQAAAGTRVLFDLGTELITPATMILTSYRRRTE